MRPLTELPTDGIRGIFADIDDTLTAHGKLVPAAYEALCAARTAGLRVVLATGRPGGYGEVLAQMFPAHAVVTENGGYAVLEGGTPRYWDGEEARAAQRARLSALLADVQARLPFAELARDAPLRRVDLAFDVHEHRDLSAAQVDALAALVRAHGARVLTSSIHLHAFYGDHDKARMLVRLAGELWSERPDEVRAHYVFVGDSPNDQAAFAAFPRAVGVANVRRYQSQLQPPPAFVATRETGEGFAEVVRHVLGDGRR